MPANPPVDVQEYGQSIWLDYIHRRDIENGELQRRIDEDGVIGMTSNPSIFQKAIGGSNDYDESIMHMLDLDPHDIYERLAIADIQAASDMLRPVYDRTRGHDGYVSLEVSPLLADNTADTIHEAKRLFKVVDRPNLMIKIPATPAGIPAIEESIASGINVNVTLIFAVENYAAVAEAYIRGLERRMEAGQDISQIASVASFFLSRIDSMIDNILENQIRSAQMRGDTARITANRNLLGKAAVANARLAYWRFKDLFYGERFQKLKAAGARVQRPLWASTSTKNPAYPDTKYIDSLIGKDTVNTVPPETLNFFKDHGTVAATLDKVPKDDMPPQEVLDRLAELGIDMAQITQRLQEDGVDAFIVSFESMIEQVASKRLVLHAGMYKRQKLALGIDAEAVNEAIEYIGKGKIGRRIWQKDGTVWKDHAGTIEKIKARLGWLDVQQTIDRDRLQALQEGVKDGPFEHIVLMGMGGSSLAPEVLYKTFGKQEGFPELIVLDSTDPTQVQAVERAINIKKTLFIVSSKSGTTVETLSFYKYFYFKTGKKADQFIAITDPGTPLADLAREKSFRNLFINPADIGGRYSALSYFGMVPAALMGLDLHKLWESADLMIEANNGIIASVYHPGITLGAVIGALGLKGRDKICIYTTQSITSFGNWAEQLLAESIGKEGKGVVPVVGATVGNPHDYPTDRVFIYLRVDDDPDAEAMDAGIRTLRTAGHPRVTLRLPDKYAIAGEFFRFEFATAVVGHLFGLNPFDEPNVTEAKNSTKDLLAQFKKFGKLPATAPRIVENGVEMYTNEITMGPLQELCRSHEYNGSSLLEVLAAQVTGTHAGDYFAVLAYLPPTPEIDEALHEVQRRLRHVTKRAVTVGYGPRYLHSTGQLHKGGPSNGVFFQLTHKLDTDIDIPETPYTFGTLFTAQAGGDLDILHQHKLRAIRLHFTDDVMKGIQLLLDAIDFVEQRRQ